MQVERQIVEFCGPDGGNLVGVLSIPPADAPHRKVLVIMSHGGLSHKVGAYRAQYELAEYFAARGCSVFRFDPAGMGDSDGVVPDNPRQDLFGSIESGLFKESYRAAFEHLARQFPDHRWVVSGVCGGAISSLLGGVESPHPISGYALISCPVVMDGVRFDYSRREPTATAMKYLRVTAAKIVSPRAIWRFVTFQSQYSLLWTNTRSVLLRAKDKFVKKFAAAESGATAGAEAMNATGGKPPVGLSPVFVSAARQAMKKSKVLFIYGNNDGFLWDFTDLYAAAHLSESQRDKVLRVIAHANHMFIWPEWQQQAFELIDSWIASEVAPAGQPI